MVKVSIEVRSGAARFRVGVRAESIEQAVSLTEKRFPGRNVKASFPIDPEGYFGGVPPGRSSSWLPEASREGRGNATTGPRQLRPLCCL